MTKTQNFLDLKGITYSDSVTDSDLAVIDGVFSVKQHFKSEAASSSYIKGMRVLDRLISAGNISINSLFFYQKLGNIHFFNFAQFIGVRKVDSKLYKELAKISDSLGLNKKIMTEDALKAASTNFQQAVEVFHYLTKIKSIDDVSIETFREFIAPLRTEDDRWHPDLNSHTHKAMRALALCFDRHFNVADYVKYVEVQRSDTRGKTKDLFAHPQQHMKEWVNSWNAYLNAKKAFVTKGFKDSATKFRDFLEMSYQSDSPFPQEPQLYFSKYRNEEFYTWLNDLVAANQISDKVLLTTLSSMNDYSNWFIATNMSDTDEDGELVTVGHPLMSQHKFSQIQNQHGGEDTGDIKLSESSKPSPPLWMILKLKEILTENDFAWPKSLSDQYSDNIIDNGNPVWIPVITYLFLIMLEIPLRKIQVLRLDSGEGDQWKYDANSDIWIKNDHQLANYWKKIGNTVHNRGVFRRKVVNGILAPQFTLYINSNKTADKKVGFGEKSGYEIPWKNPNVIKYIDELRKWQEQYNPVTAPVRYKDIPTSVFEGDVAEEVLKKIPDRFYLFRSAKDIKNGNRQMPPTIRNIHEYWLKLMDELEKRLHDEGVECKIILTRNKNTGAPQSALYSPHGLRVAGLTSLAQQGVPIEVLSKIVAGHKSILMTIYYLKFHPSHISEVLNEASRDLELNYQKSFQDWLKEASWEQVAEYGAYNSEDAIEGLKSLEASCTASLWNSTNLGLCPYNGTRCKDGGSCVRKNGKYKKKNTYLPVEDKNCVMCRHFITGLPWLTELWVHGNALLLKSEKIAKEIQESQYEVQGLKVKRIKLKHDGEEVPPQLITKIKKAETLHERLSIQEDQIFQELHATHNLIEMIKKLPKPPISLNQDNQKDNFPALMMHSESEFELDYVEAPHNFRNLDFVIQASRFYKHERNEDFERERDQFIDAILMRNGYEPMMLMDLSPEEKRLSADAFAKFLVTKVDAEALQHLRDGRKSLAELGIEKELLEAVPVNIPVIHHKQMPLIEN